jgi:hypothetical protein
VARDRAHLSARLADGRVAGDQEVAEPVVVIAHPLLGGQRHRRHVAVDREELPRVLAVVEMSDAGAPSRDEIGRLAERYQLPFAQPDWLPDVIARYNLTPPPGA